jgi:hypothetical protein
MKRISYVLVSRNDNYNGDSVGRCVNTVNHACEIISKNNVVDQSEVVLVDWCSKKEPLKDAIHNRLVPESKGLLKIVTVPPDIANKHQGDSPFSEVHAMNVGFRKMDGKHFARIDQDTLIGQRFMDWFYHEYEVKDYGWKWPRASFCSRRNLNEEQSHHSVFRDYIYDQKLSYKVDICHEHNHYSRLMPNMQIFPFYGGAVGVMMVERECYLEHKGFNEELVYMNSMDTEFLNRIAAKEEIYNLCLAVDADFYHQHHDRDEGASNDTTQPHAQQEGERKTNPLDVRQKMIDNPNPDSWGLNEEDLEVTIYE